MANRQLVAQLAAGLPNIDIDHVSKLTDEYGLYGAARVLGYDIKHYDNLRMAGRLAIQNLRETVALNLEDYARAVQERLNEPVFDFIMKNSVELQEVIEQNKHHDFSDNDWFSANTLIKLYMATLVFGGPTMENPQYMWMRIAVQFYHKVSLKRVIVAYVEMSQGWYTPASPTIFNAGFKKPQMASCFLLTINDNLRSILKHGIYRGGMISKDNGGLGFDVSRVRHSEINKTGMSKGIVPMLQLYNDMVLYVDQGGSKRKGAATVFLRPHHFDVQDFINLSLKVGDKHSRAHDINTCIWTPWLFWKRIQAGQNWTLFCPAKTPQLNDVYGKEFEQLYEALENDPNFPSKYKKVVRAQDLYDSIISVQRNAGMPYLMNGDAANIKSNHRHRGYIRSSNLCLEVIEYTDDETISVCNLHSLSLRMFAKGRIILKLSGLAALRESVDFIQLSHIVHQVIDNLNKVIDHNWYPLDKVENGEIKPKIINKSNKKDRPVGLGASGFAEMLHILDLPFEDPLVPLLNKMIFGCIYWNALARSVQLAIDDGAYETFPGSPTSEGKLQFDLWKEEFELLGPNPARKAEDDEPIEPEQWEQQVFILSNGDTIQPTWDDLKRVVKKYGLRNSLLTALMPTASTAQIRRNCESIEAHQNNLYSRSVLNGSYPVLNRYLVEDLEEVKAWNNFTVDYIQAKNGSVRGLTNYIIAHLDNYPNLRADNVARLIHIEKKYKTMWEISQKYMMKLAADRGRYVDQSASMNLYLKDCTDIQLKAAHLYANMLGLKTIMYYLRQTGGETIKFTADPNFVKYIEGIKVETLENKDPSICSMKEGCISCQ